MRGVLAPPGDARNLQIATFLETCGLGVFLTVGVLHFTQQRELPASDVGLALTISGLLGLVTGIPLGRLADRANTRLLLTLGLGVQAVAAGAYVVVADRLSLIAATCIFVLGEQTAYGARGAIMGAVFTPEERVTGRARMRATNNAGMALGGGIGAAALAIGTGQASATALAVFAVALLVAGFWSSRLRVATMPGRVETRAANGSAWGVLADRHYLAVIVVCSVIAMHAALFEVGMPLWVADHTTAPHWVVGALVALATLLVVFLQVPLSAGADDVPGASRKQRRAGLLLLVSCALFAAASVPASAVLAVVVLLLAAAAYVLGEIGQAAGAWGLSYALGDESRMGEYQAAFGTGVSAGARIAPVVVTGVVLQLGAVGWIGAGLFLAVAATVAVPFAAWAARSQPDNVEVAA